jgi:hypothetical protein
LWAVVNPDGSLSNVVTGTPATVNKMVLGTRTASKYESNDTSHGVISTIEGIGVRLKLSYGLYVGVASVGDRMAVSTFAGSEGKLFSIENKYETGTYEVVARVEEAHITDGWIIVRTVSPKMVVVT